MRAVLWFIGGFKLKAFFVCNNFAIVELDEDNLFKNIFLNERRQIGSTPFLCTFSRMQKSSVLLECPFEGFKVRLSFCKHWNHNTSQITLGNKFQLQEQNTIPQKGHKSCAEPIFSFSLIKISGLYLFQI